MVTRKDDELGRAVYFTMSEGDKELFLTRHVKGRRQQVSAQVAYVNGVTARFHDCANKMCLENVERKVMALFVMPEDQRNLERDLHMARMYDLPPRSKPDYSADVEAGLF